MHVVTGGAGFIGSRITAALAEGNDVTVIDNLHTGTLQNINLPNVKIVKERAGALLNMKINDVEAVFHEGVYSSSPMYKSDPFLVAEAIRDHIAVLEFCRKNDARLVMASTSSVYNGHQPPHREDMEVKVSDFYTEARYGMERLFELYHKLYAVKGVALRYFSVYGPYEAHKKQYANMISQFMWDIAKEKSPLIYGDGEQTRDFVYVDDVVRANLLAVKYDGFNVINVGTGLSHSFNEIVDIINRKLGKKVKPTYVENPIRNYVMHTRADTVKAEKEIGFKAEVGIEEGISRVIEWNKKMRII